MTGSLRQRLVVILLALILFGWGASALITGAYAGKLMLAQVDRQLEYYADLVGFITQVFARQEEQGLPLAAPLSIEDFDSGQPMVIEAFDREGLSPALNIWLGDRLLAVLESSPQFSRPKTEGFFSMESEEDGSHWRVLARFDKTTELWTLVGIERDAARWALLAAFGGALLPLLVVLPLTVAILYFGVTRGLSPLKSLARDISRRNPRLLDPVDSVDVPQEIQPVVDSLNTLLQRLSLALEGEQRFTANAAHELMTPLAAIKTEVQLCQRQLTDPNGDAMLERIVLRVDRASHTVEQLLTMAKVDPDSPMATATLDLRALVVEILAETGHLATDRGLEVDLQGLSPLEVRGSEEALAILLRNLLANAFRYAEANSVVRVRLSMADSCPLLEICNACQPLSAEEYARITERFYRVPGSSGLGAGLGLSIVLRIAQQHNAVFSAEPDECGSGFCSRVKFPGKTVL
jgi:signal transduction histidine kinase